MKNFFWNPLLLLEAHHSLYFHRAHTLFNCMFEYVYWFEKILLKTIASAWSPPLSVLSKSAYFCQLYVWKSIMFQWPLLKAIGCAWSPTHIVLSQSSYFVQLYVCMFILFWKKNILKAIASAWSPPLSVLLQSAYFVQLFVWMCKLFLKNIFWKPLLLLEAHHSVYFHRAHTLFKCMFECV